MAALARHARERGKKRTVTGHPVAPKAKWTGPSEKQWDLWAGKNYVVGTGRDVEATNLNTITHPFTEVPKQPEMTTNRKMAKAKKPVPKATAAPKPTTVKPKMNAVASVKTVVDKPTTNLVVHPAPTNPMGQHIWLSGSGPR